jgi:hypothetical protein
MDHSPTISRRTFLQGSSALLGSYLLATPSPTRAAGRLELDFRGGIPREVSFRRASGASVVDDDTRLRNVPRDTPRFPLWQGAPLGLLIEGEASNLIAFASRPNQRGWVTSGGVSLATVSTAAPDGRSLKQSDGSTVLNGRLIEMLLNSISKPSTVVLKKLKYLS